MRHRTLVVTAGVVLLLGAAAALLLLRREPAAEGSGDLIQALQRGSVPPSGASSRARRTRTTPPVPKPSALPALVGDTNWRVRLRAATLLAERPEIPAPRRAELLLEALGHEVAAPASGPPLAGSYLPLSGVIRLHYVHLIEDLGSAGARPARAAAENASGERREWASIAFGASGDSSAAAALRELLRTSRHADVRMSAAYFLGRLGDHAAAGDLKAALTDPATAQVRSDVSGIPDHTLYPVREQAAGALQDLGFEVQRRGQTFIVR
jgi:HEAT repeat protein